MNEGVEVIFPDQAGNKQGWPLKKAWLPGLNQVDKLAGNRLRHRTGEEGRLIFAGFFVF